MTGGPRHSDEARYASYFRELDAWTEYWDIYHPETLGRYYFGNGTDEAGLLTRFLPREIVPPVFLYWKRFALYEDAEDRFADEARAPEVAEAVLEVDALVARIFREHFGDATSEAVRADYLHAIHQFAIDTLPEARDRDALIAPDDPRKPTAGRHTLDGDLMWFAWALHLEAASLSSGRDEDHARRALLMAGVATGCPANFAWRGHRRTRPEYRADEATAELLQARGLEWSRHFSKGAAEVRALFRIREWGEP
ncbi:MAG: hypothetical protein QOE68_4765 [Thermoanaerobaculia bacterium]|nr:hypothetical protein [Thermoanaerobaculia bacterium]